MSFSVEIRSVEELAEDPDDPLRELVYDAYGHRPLVGPRLQESFFQFSYQALPPEGIKRVIGEIEEAIGILVDDVPETGEDDAFSVEFFSVPRLARALADRYPEVATRTLDDVYRGYATRQFNDEQVFASVLMDFAIRRAGYPVVVFGW